MEKTESYKRQYSWERDAVEKKKQNPDYGWCVFCKNFDPKQPESLIKKCSKCRWFVKGIDDNWEPKGR